MEKSEKSVQVILGTQETIYEEKKENGFIGYEEWVQTDTTMKQQG